jgi:hypothetical protein
MLKETTDIWDLWPFGISVAAIKLSDNPNVRVWKPWDGQRTLHMGQVFDLLEELIYLHEQGYTLAAQNGTGFDWRLMAMLTNRGHRCADLSVHSFDPCFQVLCMKGFPVGLRAMADAWKLPDKEMNGEDAPFEEDVDKLIEYVTGDVVRLDEILKLGYKHYRLAWISKAGAFRSMPLHPHLGVWMQVGDCLKLPFVDQGWMTDPLTREDVVDWWRNNGT